LKRNEIKIITEIESTKLPLPKGKITVKRVHSRNVFQVYVGGKYLDGCSGDTREEAMDQIKLHYSSEG